MERLQKIIAGSGIASRRKAEKLILEGKVSVNGKVVTELGTKANYNDEIKVDGQIIKKEEPVVFLFNKPKNVISSCKDDKGRETVLDYVKEPYRLYPLGRLDYDSSGLLLLTNDGDLTQKILHPKYEIEKTYEVTINSIINNAIVKDIEKGVRIEDYISSPCEIIIKNVNENKKITHLTITIHEGKNREIRKMFKTKGIDVTKLHRIKEANISLGDLKNGEYRRLKPYELSKLKKYLDNSDGK